MFKATLILNKCEISYSKSLFLTVRLVFASQNDNQKTRNKDVE